MSMNEVISTDIDRDDLFCRAKVFKFVKAQI